MIEPKLLTKEEYETELAEYERTRHLSRGGHRSQNRLLRHIAAQTELLRKCQLERTQLVDRLEEALNLVEQTRQVLSHYHALAACEAVQTK